MDNMDELLLLNERLKILESNNNSLKERLLIVNKNMIDEYKKILEELKLLSNAITEIKSEQSNTQDIIKSIIKELDGYAKKDSVKVLEKYINLWSPLNFITKKEAEKLIEEKLPRKTERHKPKSKRPEHRIHYAG